MSIEQVRNELKTVRARKSRNDDDVANLEGMPEIVENAALEQALEEAKIGSQLNAKKIDLLLNKESELLLKIRQFENRMREVPKIVERSPSIRQEEQLSLPILGEEVIVERSKKTKKTKRSDVSEGGRRRSQKKNHKKTKKYYKAKHHKNSRKQHKKTYKKY